MHTYIQILDKLYPNVHCSATGNGSVYNTLVWESGDAIPSQETLDAAILAEIKNEMWRLIQAKREQVRAGGTLVGTDWFHSDDSSRLQQLALVMLGANMPTGIMWKTMSGSFVEMTPTLAGQIFSALITKEQTIYYAAEVHKATMLASSTPESYDYSTGWPAVYTG